MAPILAFWKTLTPSDINDRLYLRTEDLHILPPFPGNELTLKFDVSPCGAARPLWRLCLTRRGLNNPKPVITRASWSQIVRFGKLEPGDRLTFFIDDEEYPRYKIMVERIGTKIFGYFKANPDGTYRHRLI